MLFTQRTREYGMASTNGTSLRFAWDMDTCVRSTPSDGAPGVRTNAAFAVAAERAKPNTVDRLRRASTAPVTRGVPQSETACERNLRTLMSRSRMKGTATSGHTMRSGFAFDTATSVK